MVGLGFRVEDCCTQGGLWGQKEVITCCNMMRLIVVLNTIENQLCTCCQSTQGNASMRPALGRHAARQQVRPCSHAEKGLQQPGAQPRSPRCALVSSLWQGRLMRQHALCKAGHRACKLQHLRARKEPAPCSGMDQARPCLQWGCRGWDSLQATLHHICLQTRPVPDAYAIGP